MAEPTTDATSLPWWLRSTSRLIGAVVDLQRRRRPDGFPADELGARPVTLDGTAAAWLLPAARPDAPTVLVSHGFGASAAAMAPIAVGLQAAGRQVVLLDDPTIPRPQRDGSAPQRGPGDALDLALDWVLRDRDRPVALLGHSVGGSAALGLAARRPDAVAAVVTLGAVGDPAATRMSAIPESLNRRAVELIERRAGRDLRREMGVGAARRIDLPVLVVHGTRDRTIPVHNAHVLAAAGPHVTLALVPDAGHDPVVLYRSVAERVDAFLGRTLPR